jgi:hypothetical protein
MFSILTMSRGDENRIEEWIRYHVGIGFDDFTIVLDNPIDNTEGKLKGLDVQANIRVLKKPPVREYYDGLNPAERWKAVQLWQVENADEIARLGLPINDAIAYRQYLYYPEQLAAFAARDADGWVALIDVDEFIVLEAWSSVRELTAATQSDRIRFLNFNFDTSQHAPGRSFLRENTMRWSRDDVVAYGKGWEDRVKSLVRYRACLPLVSVHAISLGNYWTVPYESGRLHHYKWPPMEAIPHSQRDTTLCRWGHS